MHVITSIFYALSASRNQYQSSLTYLNNRLLLVLRDNKVQRELESSVPSLAPSYSVLQFSQYILFICSFLVLSFSFALSFLYSETFHPALFFRLSLIFTFLPLLSSLNFPIYLLIFFNNSGENF